MNSDSKTSLDFKSVSQQNDSLDLNGAPKPKSRSKVRVNLRRKPKTNQDVPDKSSNLEALLEESLKYIKTEKKPSASFYLHGKISNDSLIDNEDETLVCDKDHTVCDKDHAVCDKHDTVCDKHNTVCDKNDFNTNCNIVESNKKFGVHSSAAAVNMNVKKQGGRSNSKKPTPLAGSTAGGWKAVMIDLKPNPAIVGPYARPPTSKRESLQLVNERRRSLNRDIMATKSTEIYKVMSRLKNESSESELIKAKKEKERKSRSAKCRSPPLVIPAGFVNIFDGPEYKCPVLNAPEFKNIRSKSSAASRDRSKKQSQRNKEVTSNDTTYVKADSSKQKFKYYEDIDAAIKMEINDRVRSIERLKKRQEKNKAESKMIADSLFGKSSKNKK